MVKLSIAFHEGINRPENHEDDDEMVQATNLWFDAEMPAEVLLDVINRCDDEHFEAMSGLFEICYEDATHFYRIWDNVSPATQEDVTHLSDDFTPESALGHHEWHAEVDWDNGRYLTILGVGFSEEMASEELIDYLKNR
jgi:hypothetical protein